MAASYTLKIDRAKKHIIEAGELLKEKRPFRYTVESDYNLGRRSIGAKRNEAVIDELSLIIGDAIHNLRTALDHRVYDLVAPHCADDRERKSVQFPFPHSGSEEHIKSAFKNRKIDRAPKEVWTALEKLKPYPGGNDDLVLLHELDIIDKHKLFIPSADYSELDCDRVRTLIPDFPRFLHGTLTVSNNGRDVAWGIPPRNRHQRRAGGTFEERDLPLPVQIIISEPGKLSDRALMPTLYDLVAVVERALGELAPL